MTSHPQLRVSGLEKTFDDDFSLSAVEFSVNPGEVVALLGPSGCGKTTALRCIAGVEQPDAGEISIGDDQVFGGSKSVPPEHRNVGMVYQSYAIWPHKTVYENVVFPLEHTDTGIEPDGYERRVDDVLELLEIAHVKRSPATDLSGGQQQRTALARSLVHDPDLLLLDEPLSNLDRELRRTMRYELQALQSALGTSVLYVTHNQAEAFYLADRVLVMNDGRIVERGTPRELSHRPKTAFTRNFVGDRNRFEAVIDPDGTHARSLLVDVPLDTADVVADAETLTCGTTVQCFLDPRVISIGQYAQRGGDVIELTGTVLAEGLLDDRYEITVGFAAGPGLIVHTESYRDVTRGEDIHLHFHPGEIQVYDHQP